MGEVTRRQLMLGVSAVALAQAVLANGSGRDGPVYQWFLDGKPIPGATGDSLTQGYMSRHGVNLFDGEAHDLRVVVTVRNPG